MKEDKKWHVLQTRPKAEKKVSECLTKKNIVHYWPRLTTTRRIVNKIKTQVQPLFDRYIFVKISEDEKNTIQSIDGVHHFIYWLDHPAIINPEEIGTIKKYVENYERIQVERIPININKIITTESFFIKEELLGEQKKYTKTTLPSLGVVLIGEVIPASYEVIGINQKSFIQKGLFKGTVGIQ